MVSVRKRKTAKSGVHKVTRKNNDRRKHSYQFGNSVIKANWDNNLTLAQNYQRLGLRSKLGKKTGGSEKTIKVIQPMKVDDFSDLLSDSDNEDDKSDNSTEDSNDPKNILEGTAKIVKDKDGKIVKVIYGTKKIEDEEENSNVVEMSRKVVRDDTAVKELEEMAEKTKNKPKKERRIESDEFEWLGKLYEKYGDDYKAMQWDRKLNPFQESAGVLKRKFKQWLKQVDEAEI